MYMFSFCRIQVVFSVLNRSFTVTQLGIGARWLDSLPETVSSYVTDVYYWLWCGGFTTYILT